MHDERLEHELFLLRGKSIILVHPSFGRISYSYAGIIQAINEHPIIFHVIINQGSVAVIFTVEDVDKLEFDGPTTIIRLKGPHDYREDYTKV